MISVQGIFRRRTGSKTFDEFCIEIVIALISSRPFMRNHLNSMQMSPTSGTETIKSDCFRLYAMYTAYQPQLNCAVTIAIFAKFSEEVDRGIGNVSNGCIAVRFYLNTLTTCCTDNHLQFVRMLDITPYSSLVWSVSSGYVRGKNERVSYLKLGRMRYGEEANAHAG